MRTRNSPRAATAVHDLSTRCGGRTCLDEHTHTINGDSAKTPQLYIQNELTSCVHTWCRLDLTDEVDVVDDGPCRSPPIRDDSWCEAYLSPDSLHTRISGRQLQGHHHNPLLSDCHVQDSFAATPTAVCTASCPYYLTLCDSCLRLYDSSTTVVHTHMLQHGSWVS